MGQKHWHFNRRRLVQWKRLNSQVAHGVALVLGGLHHTATPATAADVLRWRNAEQRVQHGCADAPAL
jgi:hypothetical protein